MNILRRLPLSRLLLLCALVLAIGVSATALALAIGAGPTPPPKPLAQAIHDALAPGNGAPIEGLSASVTWTDHLLEGASLADGGQSGELTSSPLVSGASGRLWIAKDGRLRLELQSQKGDTQILYDGHTVTVYDAATNTLYKLTPPAGERATETEPPAGERATETEPPAGHAHEVPTVAKIEEAIAHLSEHADVSSATPTDIAGQPAYTVRVSPKEGGSLFGGVELSFDADHGIPLRSAVYSSTSASPVAELAATEISYGPVASSVFEVNPPPSAKVEEVKLGGSHGEHEGGEHAHGDSGNAQGNGNGNGSGSGRPKVTTYGHGPATIAVLESSRGGEGGAKGGAKAGAGEALEGLPKVTIDGVSASELRTELGTILSFERGGVSYLLAGSVSPGAIEAVARGL
jgi:outer membrane lipoprotein-sorting protein